MTARRVEGQSSGVTVPPSLLHGAPGETRWVPAQDILCWAQNPRNIEPAVHKVAASLRVFGFVAPVIVWASRGRLVAGHTRLAALETCLATDPTFIPAGAPAGVLPGMAPVHFHEFASEEAAAAYAIADNRLNELAQWDAPALGELLTLLPKTYAAATGFEVDLSDLRLPTDLPSLPSFPEASGRPASPTAPSPSASDKPKPAPQYPPPKTFAVAVVVGSAAEQARLYELLHAMTFPGIAVAELKVLSV